MMKIFLNGEERFFESALTIDALLQSLQIPPNQIAVAINNEVVARADFNSRIVANADKVDILRPAAGG